MQLEEDKQSVHTLCGSICSLLLIVVVASYAYQKTDVWLQKKDVDIMTSTQTDFFDEHYVFDYKQGLNFAVSFTAYDLETENILDPSYGSLTFVKYSWGENENGSFFSK